MSYVNHYLTKPALRILIPLALGIVFSHPIPNWKVLLGLLIGTLSISFLFILALLLRKRGRIVRVPFSIPLVLTAFTAGYMLNYFEFQRTTTSYVPAYGTSVVGILSKDAQLTSRYLKMPIKVLEGPQALLGKEIMLYKYQPRTNTAGHLLLGDTIACTLGKTTLTYEQKHASYGTWLRSANMAARATLKPNKDANRLMALLHGSYQEDGFVLSRRTKAHNLFELASDTRQRCIERLRLLPLDKQDQALLAGITLGYRSADLENISENFRKLGVSHILSVSGFHLGIVVAAVGFLLSFMRRMPRLKPLYIVLLIVAAWVFTFITGLAAPTIRAALIVTLYSLGWLFHLSTDRFNTLAGAALLQLIYHPASIFDIGFQLSYLAVLSILMFYPLMRFRNIKQAHVVLRYLYDSITICIAAQALTIPLVLYHFGSVSLIFLWSNVPLVFLSSLLIPLALLYLILYPVLPLSYILQTVIIHPIRWLSYSMEASMQFFIPQEAPMYSQQVQHYIIFMLYAVMLIVFFYFDKRKTKKLEKEGFI